MIVPRPCSLKIIGFLVSLTGFGAVIGWLGYHNGYPLGWLGALALVAWAVLARRHWQILYRINGSEPGAPERTAWQKLAGYALIFGHLAFGYVNPHIDLHVGSGNYLALDNWTLILGAVASAMVFKADSQERDERDERISAFATLWGYRSLIGLLIVLLTFIAFMPPHLRSIFDHFVIGNLMVGVIVLSLVVRQAVQLLLYTDDRAGQA
jgi:hypothetical protein